MPGSSGAHPGALPRSHYFLTVSRGDGIRTFALRSIVVHAGLVVVPLLLLLGLGSGLLMVFHDDLVAALMRRETAMQYAYEDRIETLHQDLERQSGRDRVDAVKLDGRLRDLFARQAQLESRATLVASLAGSGPVGGASPQALPRVPLPPEITGRIEAPPAAALGYAAPDKPRPLIEPSAKGPAADPRPEDHASTDATVPVGDRLKAADLALDRIESAQTDSVTRIGAAARRRTAQIRGLIEEAGLSPERFLAKPNTPSGAGGPFVPLPEGQDGAFGRAVAALRGAVATASRLDDVLGRLPLAVPLPGRPEVTSPFGARLDPFLGRPALHTGVDLHEGFGVDIHATAAGRVIFAGTAGGYGNMVEVDHGSGLTTRYAHMGQIGVVEGQPVTRGSVLGLVGATGRATGPHLHYEVRVDGDPVDPTPFLAGAERLAALRRL